MFCQSCGSPLDEGARFCKSCGNAVPGPAPRPQVLAADPVQVLSNHVRVLGVLWLVYSIFHILMSVCTLAFSHYFLPAMQDAFSHGNIPFPFPIFRFMHMFYALSAIYGVATGIPGIFAGVALLQGKRMARALAIVAAFICVISIPFGTAIGIYTLVILLPGHVAPAYEQIAQAS
jgi:hypothetical protein